VERATHFSDEVVHAMEDNGRAVLEAVERFLVSVEDALPQVEIMRGVEKKITKSALEMVKQLVSTQSDFVRKLVDSAGDTLSRSEPETAAAEKEK
jgi:archaellum component FlaC